MRWLILTDDWPPCSGGVAVWAAAVAGGLVDAGMDVTVLARHRASLFQPSGVVVRGVRGPRFGRLGGLWTGLAARRELLEADAVLAVTWPVASWCSHTALHVVFHGSDLTRPPVSARGLSRVRARARHRWAVSAFLAEQVEAKLLPAPVSPSPIAAVSRSRPRHWGWVGRMTELKGADRFLRLVAQAGARGVLVGDGPQRRSLEGLARKLGARVRFTGSLGHDEALAELLGMDLCVLLPRCHPDGSGAEGLGLSLLEAAAAGLPVVGCATGGVPEALGPAGLLLDDPDDVDGSSQQIAAWYDPAHGLVGRDWVGAQHGVGRLVAQLLDAS